MTEAIHSPASPSEWAPTLTWRRRGDVNSVKRLTLAVHGAYVIGRLAEADIQMDNNPTASRRHAELQISAGKVRVLDIGSTNGTFVGGQRLNGGIDLAHLQEFRIGELIFAIEYPLLPGDTTPQASATRPLGTASAQVAEALRRLDDEHANKLPLVKIKSAIEEDLGLTLGLSARTVSRRLNDLARELRVDPSASGTRLIQAILDQLRERGSP